MVASQLLELYCDDARSALVKALCEADEEFLCRRAGTDMEDTFLWRACLCKACIRAEE